MGKTRRVLPRRREMQFFEDIPSTELVRYKSEAFPRLKLLQTRINDVMDMAKTDTLQSPHIRFVCDGTFAFLLQSTNECSKFSVKGIHGKYLGKHEVCHSSLVVTVCILQPDDLGMITTKDRRLLERLLWNTPHHDIHSVIYIINTNQCTSASLKHWSEQISKIIEPYSLVNTIFSRLFEINSPEIPLRISLYFEKTLLDKLPIKNTDTETLKQLLMSQRFKAEATEILVSGPLEKNVCKSFLRQAAYGYRWQGQQYLRLPWQVERVKQEVKDHVCESLSKAIATALVRHLNEYLRTHNINLSNDLEHTIDLSILKYNFIHIITTLLSTMFFMLLGTIPTIVAIGLTLIFSVNVAELTFRIRIADTMHQCIMQKRDEIITMVLHRFGEDCWKYIDKIRNVLTEFGKRNERSILFHEYKTITERNFKIKACGLFGKTIKIYILNTERNEGPIRKYLRKYAADHQLVHICEHHEITVAKYLIKSGNKVVVDLDLQVQYGTVSFPMKDKDNRYYCATCKHATLSSSSFGIQTDGGEILPAERCYRSCDFDFSLLKFNIKNIACKHGIRTDQNKFVSGEVLENDMMPNEEDLLYKWGATTGLTKGHCKGVLCTKKLENEKYDMETIIVEGMDDDFAKCGDSGSLVCIIPDDIVYTSHMAAFILIGKLQDFEQTNYTNLYTCYKVSVPLMEMENDKIYSNIKPCF